MYGQTEATARITSLPPDRLGEKLGSVGLPLDNLLIRIVDDEGRELAMGQTGEIQVRGPSVCSGYFDEPEATERRFSDGWLKTGDLACHDEEGYLWIKGRTSEFVKIRGVRISFGEVERKVAAVPGVYECAATATRHSEAGEALALFIVADDGASIVAERVRHALPPQWTCVSVRVVPELPKTENGKIARSQLRTMA
jgi:acyl-CoA synthetase (AMP-forming)/AMP-acid ligase II